MLNAYETQLILERFFSDCYNCWLRYCKDEREAYTNAINDIEDTKRDPFSPQGEWLDEETRTKFIKYKKQNLG